MLKAYKITERSIFYKVGAPARVKQALVNSLHWPAELRGLCLEFKSVKLNPAKPISPKLSPKYTATIACYSPAGGIKVGGAVPAAAIVVRPPKSLAEFRRVAALDEKIFLRLWGKKMSPEAKAGYSLMSDDNMRKIKALIAFKEDKPVAFFGYMPFKGVSGKTYDAVTSWNLFPGLSAAEGRSAFYQAGLWLKKNSKRQNSVSLGAYERETVKFFAQGGFTCCRVVVERLSGIKKKKL